MIDHCGFSVSDFARAKEFYVRALAPLAYTLIMDVPAEQTELGFAAAGFGRDGKPSFWISGAGRLDGSRLWRGQRPPNGAPGVRAHYHPNYYGAFVLDADGNNIEAVCHHAP